MCGDLLKLFRRVHTMAIFTENSNHKNPFNQMSFCHDFRSSADGRGHSLLLLHGIQMADYNFVQYFILMGTAKGESLSHIISI